ncbi:MAG: SURF1 family protein [Sphingobium sp.]|nr:SURF1 family protein [Sphingobium sp.]
MNRRLPIIATLVVGLAVAAMIGLGVWQLARLKQKEAALAAYQVNLTRPVTAYPAMNPADDRLLFRTLAANCLRVTGWQVIGGRSRDGAPGWRHIATCATGAEGPGLLVDMGVGSDPHGKANWTGGPVKGRVTHEPDPHSFLLRMLGRAPPLRLMIVNETAAPGLSASPLPDPSSVPNNHFSYAMQWFFFAAVALVIYGLALRKRWREGN